MADAIEERKLATVLFADLAGSTALASDQDPERTRARLDRFYDAMAAEIEEAGGTVEKFAGDAVMAAFGAPAAQEDHAERALHAALSMQRRLDALFDGRLTLRIGVNTGGLVVGRARERSSFVSGDPVNVAARLEQGAAPGEILVGERTVASVRGAFEFSEPIVVEAKGKTEGVPARRLVRSLSLTRPRGVLGLRETFVGRDQELDRLASSYRAVAERDRPQLVTVIGDPGVGKTRLLRELWRLLEDESPPPLRRTGRCLAYGRGITYWPLGEILREHLGLLENDPPERVRAQLGSNEILGLTLGLDVAGDLHPLAARDRLHEALISFFETLAEQGPVVVLVEDVHWAEEPLLDLLERLARDVKGGVLFVATARPDFVDRRSGWGAGRIDAETIWLEPLPDDSARELVNDLLVHEVPEAFRELVVTRAEGNPFFVEEVLATLIDRGVLVRSGDEWALDELPDGLAIPDSVQAVLAARIDLLGPAEKEALQAAAVIGRTFWSGPVYDLLEGKEPDVRVLEDRDFIRRRSGSTLEGEVEFAFKHALTREVAYESLTKARRATLHARFAEWLERTIGDEAAPLLAHHYAEAANPEHADLAWADEERLRELRARAVEWLKRAGELALSRYELEEAIALLSRALEFGPTVEQQIDLYETLGRAHSFRFDGDAFWGAMEKALELCANQERRAELYMLLVCETAGRAGMWKQMPDRELVAGWVRHALDLSEPGSVTHLRTLVGGFWFEVVDNETADRAAARLAEVGDSRAVVDAFDTRKVLAFRRGHYDQALRAATAEVRAAEQAGDPETLANALEGAMAVATLCGHIEEAEQRLRRYQQIVQRFSPHHRLHATAMELELEEIRADWQRVVELLPKTREVITENLETPCVRNPRSLLVSAAAVASFGDHQTAQALEAEANSLGMHGYDSILRAPRLRLALARDDLDTVRQLLASPATERRQPWIYLPNAIAFFEALVALGDRDRLEAEAEGIGKPGTVLEPFALYALGRVRGDERLIELAADRFETFGLTRLAEETRGRRVRKLGRRLDPGD